MSPKDVDKDEKSRLIAKAAAGVFGEKGFEGTRMEDVARAAGVGKGTLYEYFRNKEELLQGSFAVFAADIERYILSRLDLSAPPTQALRNLADVSLQSIRLWNENYRFFFEYMLHISRTRGDFPLLGSMLSEFRKAVSGLLRAGIEQGVFRRDIEVEAAAAAFAAWFDGAFLHWIVLPEGPSLEEMSEHFMEMVFRGLLLPGKARAKR
jgi:AcrR family transcriptional regulator